MPQAGKANNCPRFTFPLYSEVKSSQFSVLVSLFTKVLFLSFADKKRLGQKTYFEMERLSSAAQSLSPKYSPTSQTLTYPTNFSLVLWLMAGAVRAAGGIGLMYHFHCY